MSVRVEVYKREAGQSEFRKESDLTWVNGVVPLATAAENPCYGFDKIFEPGTKFTIRDGELMIEGTLAPSYFLSVDGQTRAYGGEHLRFPLFGDEHILAITERDVIAGAPITVLRAGSLQVRFKNLEPKTL